MPVVPVTPTLSSLVSAAQPYLLGGAAVLAVALLSFYIVAYPLREARLPFRNLPGPKPNSILWGNSREILLGHPTAMHAKWMKEYGPVFRYRVVFGIPQICVTDTTAIAYLMQHTYDLVKLGIVVQLFHRTIGDGVLTAEGAQHRRQRRIMNPAFGPPAIKAMNDIFLDIGFELERKIAAHIENSNPVQVTGVKGEKAKSDLRRIDMLNLAGQMSLDVIGRAGFDYDFHALEYQKNELAEALTKMSSQGGKKSFLGVLPLVFPSLTYLPTKANIAVHKGRAASLRISQKIFKDQKQTVQEELSMGNDSAGTGKDLLSRVVRANMDPSLRADQKMTEEEVVDQISTFIIAGHETTATAITWCLYRLAQNPDIQAKLRAEVRSIGDRPTSDELNALPLLDKVVHESLRLDSPVPRVVRRTVKEHIVPLSAPIRGRDGQLMDSLHIPADTHVFIPLREINRLPEIWGPDAAEFNPYREASRPVPGVYGNLLTFFGGARNCIGYRFALGEMKASRFALLRSLEFLNEHKEVSVGAGAQVVTRPRAVDEPEPGAQFSLLVRFADDE